MDILTIMAQFSKNTTRMKKKSESLLRLVVSLRSDLTLVLSTILTIATKSRSKIW